MDWIVISFRRYILEYYNKIGLESAISPGKFHYNFFSNMFENFCGYNFKDRAKSAKT